MTSNLKYLAASIAFAFFATGPALAADNETAGTTPANPAKSTMSKEERSAARKASRAEGRAGARDMKAGDNESGAGKYGVRDANSPKSTEAERAAARKERLATGKRVAGDDIKNPVNNETGAKSK